MHNEASEVQRQKPAAESIRAGRAVLSDVRALLRQPSLANAEQCGELLNDAARHLRSAAGQLDAGQDKRLRADLERLRAEVDLLARTLSETDRMLSSWSRKLGVKANGYTERGASAPLILVKKLSVTG